MTDRLHDISPRQRGAVSFAETMYDADWSAYRRPDLDRLRAPPKQPWVFDGRDRWDASRMGRPDVFPKGSS
jgi:hypothetical protein